MADILGQEIYTKKVQPFLHEVIRADVGDGEIGNIFGENQELTDLYHKYLFDNKNDKVSDGLNLFTSILAQDKEKDDRLNFHNGQTPIIAPENATGEDDLTLKLLDLLLNLLVGNPQPAARTHAPGGLHNSAMPPRGINSTVGMPANDVIGQAAKNAIGVSTKNGPGNGNVACAWIVNKILDQNGINLGAKNSNSVVSTEKALKEGKGKQISADQVQEGDIVVTTGKNGNHIGIALDNNTVVSNSSSRAEFSWKSDLQFGGYYGNQEVRYYRVT